MALVVPTAWVLKSSWVGVTAAVPVSAMALPASATVCGLFPALSMKVKVPVREPVAVGLKTTLI